MTGTKSPFISETDFRKKEVIRKNRSRKLSDEELIKRMAKSKNKAKREKIVSDRYVRNPHVAEFVRRRAKGVCQLCNKPAPFLDRNQDPFLEEHHITWLSKKGKDAPENAVALCPNCHRKMHILNSAKDRQMLRQKAQAQVDGK